MILLSSSRRNLRCCVSHHLVRRMGKCVSHKNKWKTCSYLRWNESACKIPPNWVYCLKARLYCIQRAKMRIQVHMVLFSVKKFTNTHTEWREGKNIVHLLWECRKINKILFCFVLKNKECYTVKLVGEREWNKKTRNFIETRRVCQREYDRMRTKLRAIFKCITLKMLLL